MKPVLTVLLIHTVADVNSSGSAYTVWTMVVVDVDGGCHPDACKIGHCSRYVLNMVIH